MVRDVDGHVPAAHEGLRNAEEDHVDQRALNELHRSVNRLVEDVAQEYVGHRHQHHDGERRAGDVGQKSRDPVRRRIRHAGSVRASPLKAGPSYGCFPWLAWRAVTFSVSALKNCDALSPF